MGLNAVLHKLANLVGANDSHEIHSEIDDAVEPEKDEEAPADSDPKDEEKGEEATPSA